MSRNEWRKMRYARGGGQGSLFVWLALVLAMNWAPLGPLGDSGGVGIGERGARESSETLVLGVPGVMIGSVFGPSLGFAQDGGQSEEDGTDPWAGVEELLVTGSSAAGILEAASGNSVIGFDAETLAAIGAQDISDIAASTPNLEIRKTSATTPTFFIRGVGLNDFNSNATGAVAIYQDGIAVNAPALQLGALFDVEGVSVLRGPQGVGFGRNASAGAIKIRSKRPTGEFGGFFKADLGNFNSQEYEAVVEAPIVPDVFAARVAFKGTLRDGIFRNRCAGAPAFADRVPFAGIGLGQESQGFAPHSICGEVEPFEAAGDISDIPVGLERDLNNRNSFAGKATFTWDPDFELLPTNFTFNVHGSRRDELTTVGQAYGTGGFLCVDGDICTGLSPNPLINPPELVGTNRPGRLGGPQGPTGGNYVPIEVLNRIARLAPCANVTFSNGVQGVNPENCNAFPTGPNAIADFIANRALLNDAVTQVAEELARDLDSDPFTGDFNRTGNTRNETVGGFLTIETELPNEFAFESNLGVDRYERRIDSDTDFSPETIFHILTEDRGTQVYQDASIKGDLEVGFLENPIALDLHAWFHWEELDVDVENDLGEQGNLVGVAARSYTQTTWNGAVGGTAAIDFWDDFTLDGGLRFNIDRKDLDYTLIPGGVLPPEFQDLDESWQEITGNARLTYRVREDVSLFFKYTRGFKPGTFNAVSGQGEPVSVADAEEIDAYELSLRGSWFDDRISLTTNLFYYSYRDYQIFTTQQNFGNPIVFVTINANNAEVYGAEVETVLRPFEYTKLDVRFSWLESQFLDFVQSNEQLSSIPGTSFIVNNTQNSGNPLLNSPRFKVVLFAEQKLPLGSLGELTLLYNGTWTDDVFFDPTGGQGIPNILGEQILPELTIGQEAFWLHNLNLTWRSEDGVLEAGVWVRNLTNEVYRTFGFDATSFSNTSVHFVGDPRTYGSTFTMRF